MPNLSEPMGLSVSSARTRLVHACRIVPYGTVFTVSCCRPNTRPPGAARSKVIAVTGQLCGQTQFDDAVGKLSGGVLPTARYADRPAPVVATVVPVSVPEYTPLHDRRSTCQAKIRLPGCAIARSSRSVCESGYGAPRSPR